MGNTNKQLFLMVFVVALVLFHLIPVSSLSVSVHVPEKYTEVEAGERFYFEIEVKYPENPKRKDLRLNYEILDVEQNVIAQSKVLKAVETQASFIDFIVIPKNAKKGMYLVQVKIQDYESLSEDIKASFYVSSSSGEQIKIYFFILLGTVILIGALILIVLFLKRKR